MDKLMDYVHNYQVVRLDSKNELTEVWVSVVGIWNHKTKDM